MLAHKVFQKVHDASRHLPIRLWAKFCAAVHEWYKCLYSRNPDSRTFKRVLVDRCERSFDMIRGSEDGCEIAAIRSIRFVGVLFINRMCSSKVILRICRELVSDPARSSCLEALAVLLQTIGPACDNTCQGLMGKYFSDYCEVFGQVEHLAAISGLVTPRVQHLLSEVVKMRSAAWQYPAITASITLNPLATQVSPCIAEDNSLEVQLLSLAGDVLKSQQFPTSATTENLREMLLEFYPAWRDVEFFDDDGGKLRLSTATTSPAWRDVELFDDDGVPESRWHSVHLYHFSRVSVRGSSGRKTPAT